MKQRISASMSLLLMSGLLCHCSSDDSPPAPVSATSSTEPGQEPLPGDAVSTAQPSPDGVAAPGVSSSEGNPLPSAIMGVEPVTTPTPAGGGGAGPLPPVVSQPPAFDGRFILGADISSVQEAVEGGTSYVDTDGQQKSLIALLQNHGFNYIRLRSFVDPSAVFGYASGSSCQQKAEPYDDTAHTLEFAREVKAAQMGFLLDLHYSDTWADPGKQVIPEAWRAETSIEGLANQVRSYTVEVLTALTDAGVRPDMVQVGNEITPGLLIHVPTADTDCFGSNSMPRPGVNGSQNDWDNLATLLRAGIEGVRQVDPSIKVMLHIENTESAAGVINWVQNAQQRGVQFDVLGLSAYEAFQGPATAWRATLTRLADTFPDLSFSIAEYNPQRRLLNDIMHELPDGRGIGSFFWEPTQSGSWGTSMFNRQGNTLTAKAADFAEYDQIRTDYEL